MNDKIKSSSPSTSTSSSPSTSTRGQAPLPEGGPGVDPTPFVVAGRDGTPPYRGEARGEAKRERPSPRRSKSSRVVMDAKLLAAQLQGIHHGIAILAGNAVWRLTDAESEMLAGSISHCMDVYQWSLDPRGLAIADLITVCGMIYLPRYWSLKNEIPSNPPTT